MSEQDRVRRLLGDLRATDDTTPPAMPADLAARLDDRLAELARDGVPGREQPEPASQPAPARPDAVVVPLRRRLAPVLVAAALVLATGGAVVALGQLGDGTGSSDSAAGGSSGGSAAEESAAGGDSVGGADGPGEPEALDAPAPGSDSGSDAGSDGGSGSDSGSDTRMTPAPYLTAAGFAADARALVRDGEVATGSDTDQDAAERNRVEGSGCAVPPDARGAATLVSLDGDPAVLVVGAARADQQVVELRGCLGRVLDRTTVPAR